MKYVIIFTLISVVLKCFGQVSSTSLGFYEFNDLIGNESPYWIKLNFQDSLIVKESSNVNKSEYRSTLKYFDSLGFMYKSEKWIENRKKSKAHLVNHSDYSIKFDSINGIQVETGDNNYNYKYYDSLKFNPVGLLEYRYMIEISKLNGVTWDTITRLNVKLISDSLGIKKYEIKEGEGIRSIAIYHKNRPIYINSIVFQDSVSDTIIYSNQDDLLMVKYLYKTPDDSSYQIGEIDLLKNGIIQEKKIYRRGGNRDNKYNFKLEKYYYDRHNRLVLKTASHSRKRIEVNEFGINEHTRYLLKDGKMVEINISEYKSFPFESWKLTK